MFSALLTPPSPPSEEIMLEEDSLTSILPNIPFEDWEDLLPEVFSALLTPPSPPSEEIMLEEDSLTSIFRLLFCCNDELFVKFLGFMVNSKVPEPVVKKSEDPIGEPLISPE